MKVRDIETWYLEHYERVKACTVCKLHNTCLQSIPGHGNLASKLMIVGEAPGVQEDLQGKPFVGRSGQLLNKILIEAGFHRDDFYVTNYSKCRPPDNRVPSGYELFACKNHIEDELLILNPVVVVPLGYTATYCMSIGHFMAVKPSDSMGKMRERIWVDNSNTPVRILYPTYHPSYILRSPKWKSVMVNDFKILKKYIDTGFNLSVLGREETRIEQY